jgi:glucose/mannose-6-phosphate isomerase
MLAQINSLPSQLENAWALGQGLPLPLWQSIDNVLLAGMGNSALAAELLAAYVAPLCQVPVAVHRDYDLPAWAHDRHTLVILISHSGGTEETLSTFERATEADCLRLVITARGKLSAAAPVAGAVRWPIEHPSPDSRTTLGFSFGLLLAAFTRLGLLHDPQLLLAEALDVLRQQMPILQPAVPVAQNPAKRLAGQLIGRWTTVFGSGALAPVARRWKTQLNELAKAWTGWEALPEADHNTLSGLHQPTELLERSLALFLTAPSDHPRNALRNTLTRQALMQEGLNTDNYTALGQGVLANQWSALHFGDYLAYYLALASGVDPAPNPAVSGFKTALAEQ